MGHVTTIDDKATGIIRVTAIGFLSVAQVEAHFDDLDRTIRSVRASGRAVMVLIDISDSPVQGAETAERIRIGTQRVFASSDRVAFVVQSSLAKMQMRRILDSAIANPFVSARAAELWLHAYLPEARAS